MGYDEIMAKLGRGEPLTREEEVAVMSMPDDPYQPKETLTSEEVMSGKTVRATNYEQSPESKLQSQKNSQAVGTPAAFSKSDGTPASAEKKSGEAETPTEENGEAVTATADKGVNAEQRAEDEGKKKDDKDEENKDAADALSLKRVEEVLSKPLSQHDLSSFTQRDRGLYYAMRHEREKRQSVEKERDSLSFRALKLAARNRILETMSEKAGIEKDDPLLKDAEQAVEQEERQAAEKQQQEVLAARQQEKAKNDEAIARDFVAAKNNDFDEVLAVGEIIIGSSESHKLALAEAYKNGDNVVLAAYQLIRNDPRFAKTYRGFHGKEYGAKAAAVVTDKLKNPETSGEQVKSPETRAPGAAEKSVNEAARKDAERFKSNDQKTRTSAAAAGDDGIRDFTEEEVAAMSEAQFNRLPEKVKQRIFQKYG